MRGCRRLARTPTPRQTCCSRSAGAAAAADTARLSSRCVGAPSPACGDLHEGEGGVRIREGCKYGRFHACESSCMGRECEGNKGAGGSVGTLSHVGTFVWAEWVREGRGGGDVGVLPTHAPNACSSSGAPYKRFGMC
eukprot:365446-Chlamydomonas_euryale.AAC.1